MVDSPAVVRTKLRCAHVYIVVEIHGDYEATELVRPFRGHIELGRPAQNLVRLAQLPSFRKLRQCRFVRRIAFRRSIAGPLGDQRNLLVGKTPCIFEVAISWLCFPRRHHSRPGDRCNLAGALPGIQIGQQREGRHFAWPVAQGAVLVKNGRDVLVVRRYAIIGGAGAHGGQQHKAA